MPDTETSILELAAGDLAVGLAPEVGGSVAFFRLAGTDLMRPLAEADRRRRDPIGVAMFPMVPYANIIVGNRFAFDGRSIGVAQNLPTQRFNVHGTGWQSPWTVASSTGAEAILVLDRPADPFPYRAEQRFVLASGHLAVTTTVVNIGSRRAPVGFGQHPWFPRDPDATVEFEAAQFWLEGPDHVATERLRTPPELDFATAAPLPGSWRNNCYGRWAGVATLRFPGRGVALRIEADPVFRHLMLYGDPTKPVFCLEPQTNAVGALNRLCGPIDPDDGVLILEPGESACGTIAFVPSRLAAA